MNTKINLTEANEMINTGDFITGYFAKCVITLKGMGFNEPEAKAIAKEMMNKAVDQLRAA